MMAQMKLPGAAIEGPRCALPDASVFLPMRVVALRLVVCTCDENPYKALICVADAAGRASFVPFALYNSA